MSGLAFPACRALVVDVSRTTGVELHPGYTPCEWATHQYNVEDVIDALLEGNSSGSSRVLRRVSNLSDADVILLSNHKFSRWCAAIGHLGELDYRLLSHPKTDDRKLPICKQAGGAASPLRPPCHTMTYTTPESSKCDAQRVGRDEFFKRLIWQRLEQHIGSLRGRVSAKDALPPVAIVHTLHACAAPWQGLSLLPHAWP